MAQLTNATFSINGNPVPVFKTFSLAQSVFEHHHFSLVCPAESVDGKSGLFVSSKSMIGATFGARVESVALGSSDPQPGSLLFQGIVTSVETSRFTGHHGDVIISGYSPTIVLDSGPHCKSWLNKPLSAITNDVLSKFPQNLLEPKVALLKDATLGYTVQYRESAWNFLQRITGNNGEWLFWDGRNLVIGPPKGGVKAGLVFGSNLKKFNMILQSRPTNIKMTSWDFQNSQVYFSKPGGVAEKAGLNPWGETVLKASQNIYGTQPKQWNPQFTLSQGQQDELATLKSAMESAKMVQFSGSSGHPGVNIGGLISVSGANVFSESTEGYGDYQVIGISHFIDSLGNYDNSFTAVPASIKVPPVNILPDPVCEVQSAIVTDNNDKMGLGRIRVKFHWMNDGEKTPWIRVASPHGGGGKGHFFIPELKEEVIVGFEGDSATKPYVMGTVYHGAANNSFSNAGNDVKTTQTRSGIRQVYNDAEGSYFVSDKGGVDMLFDGAGNATTNANENHTLNAGINNLVNAGNTSVINVGGTKDTPPQSVFSMDASGNIVLDGKTKIIIQVGGNKIEISKEGIVSTAADGKIETKALSGAVNIESASADASFKGSVNTHIGGGTNTHVKGSEVQINQA
ncbi:MAG: phage baseplate assembly protein V [Niabella sp.]